VGTPPVLVGGNAPLRWGFSALLADRSPRSYPPRVVLSSIIRLALLVALAACGAPIGPAPGPAPAPAPEDDAATALAELEQRLLDATAVRFAASVRATGAIEAALDGTVVLRAPSSVELRFTGAFGGRPVTLSLVSDGAVMRGQANQLSFEQQAPPDLSEALILGVTRIGLLHNLAMLVAGRPPHGTYGAADSWARARSPAFASGEEHALRFEVMVDGKATADATLVLDQADGVPVRREQLVRFSTGDMRVTEHYAQFELE